MKKIKYLIYAGLLSLFGGCASTMNVVGAVTGYGFDGTRYTLSHTDFKVSEKKEVKFQKDKAYLVMNSGGYIFKDDNGKIKLSGFAPGYLNSIIRELHPGKNTFVGFGSCGPYSVTVDAKPGYLYPIETSVTKTPLMTWCRGTTEIFVIDEYIESSKYPFSTNLSLVEKNIDKIDKIIKDAGYQAKYDDFVADKDINPKRKLFIHADQGIPIE